MIRIVDMQEAADCEGSFSVFNTVTDSFLEDGFGDQVWESIDCLVKAGGLESYLDRVRNLLTAKSYIAPKLDNGNDGK